MKTICKECLKQYNYNISRNNNMNEDVILFEEDLIFEED